MKSKIEKNVDYLLLVAKANKKDIKSVILNADDEQIAALLDCISLRLQVSQVPSTVTVKRFVSRIKKAKKIKSFLIRHHRVLRSVVVCVLSKFFYDVGVFICDSV